jgi:branched-chain amino acid transport system permease protein
MAVVPPPPAPVSVRRRLPSVPVVTAVLLVLAPLSMATDFALSIELRFCIWLILLTGLNMINGLAGMTSLAQAGFFGLGAYTAGIAAARAGVPPLVAFLLAPLVTTAAALVIGAMSLRLRAMYFTMATLGTGYVLYLLFGRAADLTGGPNGLLGIPPLSVFGFAFTEPIALYLLGAVLALVGTVVAHNVARSRTGRALRALGTSEPAAVASGAKAFPLRMFAFALSAFFAGVAGAVEAFDARFVSPSTFDFFTAVVLVVALAVGGAGTAIAPLIGAALLTALDLFAADFADYEPLIMGIVFLLAIQLFPRGVGGALAARMAHRGSLPTREPTREEAG